jgi:threonine/homoserine/homoserine lactone efflux protein
MIWHTWLLFIATEFVLCLTPGPAVLFVVSQALRYGSRRSLYANLGILSANAFYFLLSAIGLGAVLLASHELFAMVRYVGAAYLIYLGLATIMGRGLAISTDQGVQDTSGTGWRLMGRGFMLQAANPKALLFFTALLPQFIDPRGGVPFQILILGLSSMAAEFFVLAGYGLFAGRAFHLAQQPRFAHATNRLAGALLIGAGAGLAMVGRE